MLRKPRPSEGDGTKGPAGQATVELALVLPVVFLLILAVLQAALLARDHLLVVAAAREAAREAAVTPDPSRVQDAARRAAPALDPVVVISRSRAVGEPVRVVVEARPAALPVVGGLVAGRTLRAAAVMRVERAGL